MTPFESNNRVDYAALKRLINFHVENGTAGLVIAGTTGESPTLARQEHIDLIATAVELADGRLPIIAGTGSNSTAQTIDLSTAVEQACAVAAFLVVVPYYNKPTQDGLFAHFSTVADAVQTPLMLYNVPGRTVADLLPETVARLAKHENIFGIKEATGDIGRLKDIQALVNEDFRYYSGDDFTALPFMREGGSGVVSVTGNVAPALMAELCDKATRGKFQQAERVDEKLQPLNNAMFLESNPIPVKWAMAELGLMQDDIRLPLTKFSQAHHVIARRAMEQAGIL